MRDKVPCFLTRDTIEGFIAPGTAGEWIEGRFKREGGEHLFHLFLYKVTFDEQMVRSQGPITEGPVPRQDYAVLFQRKADDLVVIQRPVVQDVEPQEPHPLREPAQHDIGDEFHCFTTKERIKYHHLTVNIFYRNFFNLSEFETTLTELNAMAAEAYMGFSSPAVPRNGYKTPAAIGIPMML